MDKIEDTPKKKFPCNPDHNGECWVCDAWLTQCAFDRWLIDDYTYETKEELDLMFNDYNKKDYEDYLHGSND
jgi:hypothetical protein